jgi:DNA polymerase I
MFVELSTGIILFPGTFTAVIAPGESIIAALGNNRDLRRFLSLFVCGPASHLLPLISRAAPHFETCIPMSAVQLLDRVQGARYSIVLIEHDPSLFEGAELMSVPASAAFRDLGHEALVILYAGVKDPSFSALARYADRFIELIPPDNPMDRRACSGARVCSGAFPTSRTQSLLEVS